MAHFVSKLFPIVTCNIEMRFYSACLRKPVQVMTLDKTAIEGNVLNVCMWLRFVIAISKFQTTEASFDSQAHARLIN